MEVIRTKTIQVDFQQKINNPIPRFYRNDNNHLQIEILDNGVLADVSNITRMVINYQFENEEIISRMITDINNPIDIEIGNAEQKFEGYVFCSLQVYDFSDRLTTFPFRLVFRSPINDTQEYEDDDLTTLNELIGEVDSLKWQVITAINEMQYESGYATEQGDYAKAMGDYAKEQGDYALSQGDYALAQGTDAEAQAAYAKEQGDYALAQGTSAETQAASAQTQAAYALEQGTYAKEQGDYAKTQGNAAKVQAANAQTQGNYAKEQAENAQTQAAYALEQGTYAETQGDYAKAQGDYVKAQGVYAETQGNYAKNQGAYAAAQASAAKTQATNAQTQAEYAKSQGDYAKEVADTIVETEFAEVLAPITVDVVNDGNDFSVGVDNVGTKYDVIESSESTIELNGRTLVNLWGNKNSDFENTNNYASFSNNTITASANGTYIWCPSKRVEMFKPNTTYTIITNILANTLDNVFWVNVQSENTSVFDDTISFTSGTTGVFTNILTSKNDLSGALYGLRSLVSSFATTGSVTFQCIILEGDYTNVPISYFEGLQSAEPSQLLSRDGKNLFNINEIVEDENWTVTNNEVLVNVTQTGKYYSKEVNLKLFSDGNYTITCELDDTSATWLELYENGTYKNKITSSSLVNMSTKKEYTIKLLAFNVVGKFKFKNIKVEVGRNATQYEPYKENVTTIMLSEPLRSLPDGVKDEIYIHDDKVVVTRNCGQHVLDGSENWAVWNGTQELENTLPFYCIGVLPNANTTASSSNAVYSNFKKYGSSSVINSTDEQAMTNHTNVYVRVLKSNLSSEDLSGFKTWLQSNNVTVVYQLETPTYEWFELPSPRLYKNGHVFIESGAVPLTTTKHEVNTSIRSAIDTNTNELWDVKNDIIDTNERIDTLSSSLPTISFNDEGNLVVTINGTSKIFIPQE